MSLNFCHALAWSHLRRLIERGVDILQPAQEDDHLVTHALPYAHDGDGPAALVRAVDKRLRVDPEVRQERIQDALRAVDLHPQCGDNGQGHDHRHEKRDFKIFLAVRRFVDGQRQEQRPAALERHNDDHKFYGVQKRLYKKLVLKNIDVVFQPHEMCQLRIQREIIRKAESERKQHRRIRKGEQHQRGPENAIPMIEFFSS